jgi:hypothetical protein
VLFGADSPSACELGPRTGARLGARLLVRARAIGIDDVELRDRDGGYARGADGGAAVALIGGAPPAAACDEDIDVVVLAAKAGADARIEIVESAPVERGNVLIALGADAAADPAIARDAARLAKLLGADVVGPDTRDKPLAPELCVLVGAAQPELAGATSIVRIGGPSAETTAVLAIGPGAPALDGALAGRVDTGLAELIARVEGT